VCYNDTRARETNQGKRAGHISCTPTQPACLIFGVLFVLPLEVELLSSQVVGRMQIAARRKIRHNTLDTEVINLGDGCAVVNYWGGGMHCSLYLTSSELTAIVRDLNTHNQGWQDGRFWLGKGATAISLPQKAGQRLLLQLQKVLDGESLHDELSYDVLQEMNILPKEEAQVPQEGACCLCGQSYHDYGNNPDPLGDLDTERCCDDCNSRRVVPAREDIDG
jgi:hypothetical protein